jgi:archaemetzincin
VKPICLIPLASESEAAEALGPGQLEVVAAAVAEALQMPCRVEQKAFDISFGFEPNRGQYWSTAILQGLGKASDPGERVLGITGCDLYVPILTFVFGEAQVGGNCAVVSTARLKEEFYGMPPRADLLLQRLIKESVHELGHTLGLRHCRNWQCVMSSSHAVERIDLKEARFCRTCRA